MKNVMKTFVQWSVVLIMLLAACETTEETFSEFTVSGERIYIGKPDDVIVLHGNEKLRFQVALNADPKIKKGLLESSDGSVVHEFEVIRVEGREKDTITFDIQLDEGEYNFDIWLLGDDDASSIKTELSTSVFGTKYREALLNRSVDRINGADESAVVNWGEANSGMIETILEYEDADGIIQTIIVPNEEVETTINNYKSEGKFTVSSSYRPTENAFENFPAFPVEGTLPRILPELDKSNFSVIALANDIAGNSFSSSLTNLYNGVIASNDFYHSDPNNDPMPQHFTLDLGILSNIAEIDIYGRTGSKGSIEKNPKIMEIWGINDVTGAETLLPSTDPGWEQESLDKGWVKLSEITHPDDLNAAPTDYTMTVADPSPSVRYIRFRVLATWRADKKASHLSEITVKAR